MTFSTLASPGVSLQGGGGSGGGGTASLPISGNGATITTSTPLIDGTQTWNSGATTFTSLLLNVTDTASAAASLLMDLQVGGSSLFRARKDGYVAASLSLASTAIEVFPNSSAALGRSGDRTAILQGASNGGLSLPSSGSVHWNGGSTASLGSLGDTILTRRAAANLRLGAADAAGSAIAINSVASNQLTLASNHGLTTGAAIIITGSVAPSGTTLNTRYYARVISSAVIELYSTYDQATAASGTTGRISVTTAGTSASVRLATPFQSFGVQDFTGTDIPGQPFIIRGSRGTGTGPGGDLIFQVAPAGTTGSSQNALATALTIGGDRRLSFPDGTSIINDAPTGASNQIGIWAGGVFGLNRGGGNASQVVLYANGVSGLVLNGGTSGGAAPYLSFASPTAGTHDTFITRDAANTLALRNGANAQTFRVYNTYTSDTNYESGRLQWVGNEFRIGPETVGGTLRSMGLYVGGTRYQIIGTNFNQFDQNIYMNVANIVTDTSTGFKIGTGTTQKIGFWNATPIAQPTTAVAAATVAATGTGNVVAASTTFDGYTIPQIVKALRNAGLLA